MTMKESNKTHWKIDHAHSEVLFRIRHMMIANVKGEFREFDAELFSNDTDFENAKVHATVQVSSIFTNNNDRDEHLKSADFFNAEKFETITFESTAIAREDDDTFVINGDITIMGVTKNIILKAEHGGVITDPSGHVRAGFSISGKLNRKDFGLNWNAALETGGVLVGEEVHITADVQFIKEE